MKITYLFLIIVFLIPLTSAGQQAGYKEKVISINSNGWVLKGDLMLVNSKVKAPIVLLLNKANGDRKAYAGISKLLAKQNISSLRLDLRGHGESINSGKFIPFDSLNNVRIKLDESYKDIIAAMEFISSLKQADKNRIGIVGASYSGEEMMIAARKSKYAKAYVALSPGSFSAASIASIDSCNLSILFVKSNEEKSMMGFENDVFAGSKKAKVITVAGKLHATDILTAYPDIAVMLANWLKDQL